MKFCVCPRSIISYGVAVWYLSTKKNISLIENIQHINYKNCTRIERWSQLWILHYFRIFDSNICHIFHICHVYHSVKSDIMVPRKKNNCFHRKNEEREKKKIQKW